MIDKDDIMNAYVSEPVEKIHNKGKKDYRKRSSCVMQHINNINLATRIHPT